MSAIHERRGRWSPRRVPVWGTSLRSRWNRAFVLLTVMVLVSGVAGLLGARHLVNTFRNSAVRVEQEGTVSARIRAEVIAQAILITRSLTPADPRQLEAAQATIAHDFAAAIAAEETLPARTLLESSRARWQAMMTATGPPSRRADELSRAETVTAGAPKVLDLLDQAGSANRDAARAELAAASRTEQQSLAVLVLLELLAVMLAVRLARRLSRDLAVSFNAMADAVARSQRSLTREANRDSLSGLANRAAFSTRLKATLEQTNRRPGNQAVLLIDLDDFKDVNDALGHAAGDELLCLVADRLSATMRPGDMVARLGGDEFAVLLEDLPEEGDALTVAQRVVASLAGPAEIAGRQVHVGASVGLAMRQARSTFEGLMREADIAMYAAKANGKNRAAQYDDHMEDLAVDRLVLKADLDTAAERGELVVEYQPIVDLNTELLVGLEALVRWQHPSRGLLPPSAFIEVAERSGAIAGIGAFVLDTAVRQLQTWRRRYGLPELWMSVNVSVCQLDQPGFADEVRDVLDEAGLSPAALVLEVTETVLANPGGGAAATLAALRRTGVRVALDDFGTGYSSIAYLRQLPVDILKIDRSFLTGASPGSPGKALLEAIVAMAASLNLDVIPEGIEEQDQLRQLRAMGCLIGQGFLLSRPVPAAAIDVILAGRMTPIRSSVPEVAPSDSMSPAPSPALVA